MLCMTSVGLTNGDRRNGMNKWMTGKHTQDGMLMIRTEALWIPVDITCQWLNTLRLIFNRQHIHMYFLERNLLCFESYFTEVRFLRSHWVWINIGSGKLLPYHDIIMMTQVHNDISCQRVSPQEIFSAFSMARLIPGLRPANERRCYKVTPSLIGWAQT